MKLVCLWNERTLSRLAVEGKALPAGSRLATHVGHCADCHRVWEELSLLAAELPEALLDPLDPPTLYMPLVPMRSAKSGVLRLSLATLATSGLLLAAIASGRLTTRPVAPVAVSPGPFLASRNEFKAVHPPTDKAKGSLTKVNTSGNKGSAGHTEPRLPSTAPETAPPALTSFEFTPLTRPEASTEVAETMTPEAWGGLGACYAANGDYASAADAYARAYEAQPDPDFALAAGQNAENAGDMHEAVAYYLRVLETSTEPQSYPEEDQLWNESLVMLSLELRSY